MWGSVYFSGIVNSERTIHVSNNLGRGGLDMAVNAKTTFVPVVMR